MTQIRKFRKVSKQFGKRTMLAIIAILITVAVNSQTKDELKKCFTQYNKAIDNEFYDIAIENMQKVANMMPENFCPYVKLAKIYRWQDNYQEAINQLNKAIMLLEEDDFQSIGDICNCDVGSCSSYKDAILDIYSELISNYMNLENYDKAMSFASKLTTISDILGNMNIAWIYYAQKKYAESERYTKQALSFPEIQNDTSLLMIAYIRLVSIYESQNNSAKMIEYVKKMAELGHEGSQEYLQEIEKRTNEITCGLVFMTKSGKITDTPPLDNEQLDARNCGCDSGWRLITLEEVKCLTKNFPQLKQYYIILNISSRNTPSNQATEYTMTSAKYYNGWESKTESGGYCNWVAAACNTKIYSSSSSSGDYGYGYRRLCVKKR